MCTQSTMPLIPPPDTQPMELQPLRQLDASRYGSVPEVRGSIHNSPR